MKKYNKTIATVLAATLCGLVLMTGCGKKETESTVQPETEATETEAEAIETEAPETEAVEEATDSGEAEENVEAAEGGEATETADAVEGEEAAGTADTTAAAPDEEEYVMQTDIEGCDTFTQIVDKLEPGKGFANVTLDGTDVLLISATLCDYETAKAGVEAEVFIYSDGVPQYIGHVRSGGTATPLALKDGKLYSVGHHYVRKSTVTDGKLVTMEVAYQTFDKDGNVTYHYDSDDGGSYEGMDDEAIYDSLNVEYQEAEIIDFSIVE